jgi:hypothetical protein
MSEGKEGSHAHHQACMGGVVQQHWVCHVMVYCKWMYQRPDAADMAGARQLRQT